MVICSVIDLTASGCPRVPRPGDPTGKKNSPTAVAATGWARHLAECAVLADAEPATQGRVPLTMLHVLSPVEQGKHVGEMQQGQQWCCPVSSAPMQGWHSENHDRSPNCVDWFCDPVTVHQNRLLMEPVTRMVLGPRSAVQDRQRAERVAVGKRAAAAPDHLGHIGAHRRQIAGAAHDVAVERVLECRLGLLLRHTGSDQQAGQSLQPMFLGVCGGLLDERGGGSVGG
jgi:hypothetical protein